MKTLEQIQKKLKKEREVFEMYNNPENYKSLTDEEKKRYDIKLSEAWGKVQILMWVLGK